MRLLLSLTVLLLSQAALSAQNEALTLARGDHLDRVSMSSGGGPFLLVQDGSVIHVMTWKEGPRVASSLVLPRGTFTWCWVSNRSGDTPGAILAQTAHAVQRARVHLNGKVDPFETLLEPVSLYRGRLSIPPVRRPFAWNTSGGLLVVVPTLAGLQLFLCLDSGGVQDLGEEAARVTSEQSLGYGLGDRLSARVTIPYFDVGSIQGRDVLFFRRDAHYATRPIPDGRAAPWGRAPLVDHVQVVKFDHRVPPLLTDLDGDKSADLVHVDPGMGTTLIYRSSQRTPGKNAEPDRVFKVGGHVLWRWLMDGDGDGRRDLFLLEVSRLSVLAQVKVMQKRTLPVTLSMRPQKKNGRFRASAAWSDRFSLPCDIVMTRNTRRVHFRAPFALVPQRGKSCLLVTAVDGEEIRILRRASRGWESVADTGLPVAKRGFYQDAFSACLWQDAPVGPGRVVFLVKDPQENGDRVLMVPLPQLP